MKLRVKIKPIDNPKDEGKWITRNMSVDKPLLGDWQAPKGYVIVTYERPHRSKK